MSRTIPVRKSARSRVPNTRYSTGPLVGSDFGDSSDEDTEAVFNRLVQNADEDEEESEDGEFDEADFAAGERHEAEEEEEDEEDDAGSEDDAASREDSIETADEGELGENEDVIEPAKDGPPREDDDPWRWQQPTQSLDNNVRGLGNRVSHTNKYELLRETFGKDNSTINLAQQKWMRDPAFPHRLSGIAYPVGYVDGLRARVPADPDSLKPWFPPIGLLLDSSQSLRRNIDETIGRRYLPKSRDFIKLLAGSYRDQKEYGLNILATIDIASLFPLQSEDAEEANRNAKMKPTPRKGWILNVGGRVLSIAWAPTKRGSSQYLAISVEQMNPWPPESTPFSPTEIYPASIQIWRLSSVATSNQSRAQGLEPKDMELVRVICTEWGSARKLSWCPGVPGEVADEGSGQTIGLLASVWADGYVRVLEVDEPANHQEKFSFYTKAAFASRPPETVCSCLDWVTPEDVAVGCANGFVAIWNIPNSLLKVKESILPKPWFYHSISETYINSVSSAGSIAPHLLHTISVSGYQQLTDIRSPDLEFVTSLRSRIYQSSSAYMPHLHSYITTEENGDLVCIIGRRFFNTRRIANTSAGASGGTVVATSPLHCSILFGTPDGTIACSSPMMRVLQTRSRKSWTQKWFVHEWRERKPGSTTQSGKDRSGGVRAGTVRITEGYRIEQVTAKTPKKAGDKGKDFVYQVAFMHEEEQAITAIAWNPNIEWGTWAAAGTGSGLVRVEDIAVGEKPEY